MRTVLLINSGLNCGAPGRIAEQIGLLAQHSGWNVYIAHGVRYQNQSQLNNIPLVTSLQQKANIIYSLLLDRHGLGMFGRTKKLVKWIKENNPDVIHLHNIHGYFINYKILFEYLDTTSIPVVWTMHDCWMFTGHCAYFDSIDCQKWKTHCDYCGLKQSYPKSLIIDNSYGNYEIKKHLFGGLKNCTMVPVSEWLGDLTKESFMRIFSIRVIHNGVDIDIFKPTETNLRSQLGIKEGKIVVLGVAMPWTARKGYEDMIKLSENEDFQVVMIGVTKEQKDSLPSCIISVQRTQNQNELAKYYSMADIFVNPTYSDNFPTTNIEALACGTPVITYNTGGSPEAVDEKTGVVVPQGDVNAMVIAIRELNKNSFSRVECRKRAVEKFDKDKFFLEYMNLYDELCMNHILYV